MGSSIEHDYMGLIKDSFELTVGNSIRFVLNGLWVTEYLFPFFLLTSGVLYGSQKALGWNYEGISLTTSSGTGTIIGSASFRRGYEVEEVPTT